MTKPEWDAQRESFKSMATLNPNMPIHIYVEGGDDEVLGVGELKVTGGKDVLNLAFTLASKINNAMAKNFTTEQGFLFILSPKLKKPEKMKNYSNMRIAIEEYEGTEEKYFAATYGKVRKALALANPDRAAELLEEGDVFDQKTAAVWRITDDSLQGVLERLALVFSAMAQIRQSA